MFFVLFSKCRDMKKSLLIIVTVIVIVFLVFIVLTFMSKNAEAPVKTFKGPIGEPYIKGPTSSPPGF